MAVKDSQDNFYETMILMTAHNTIKTLPEDSSIKEKVYLLNKFNLTNEQIAKVCDTSAKIVSNYKSELNKKSVKKCQIKNKKK
ncbi:hypothetical protein EPJ66_10125 [Brachyspira aalborgi]|uniref:Uncharacterized protein n=1 Tax=Brachyspira aalborgi TaxID=29522 RepID=A0A5C8EGK4_9SPIR|nr:hypothetical protein [Brachyspira aalborgi]TXJ36863.1 hypothetical protein EPJ81_11075 [Brachyspira aalborgi]TXJ50065.1 hypothetical protein EPJ66_10125 [Brachyspira aalborgi]